MQNQLSSSPVSTPQELEAMRCIFNFCIPFMTKPFSPITPEQQGKWWSELQKTHYKAFVYRDSTGKIVAYSLLQWHKDKSTSPLFGIAEGEQGHNYAREIIQHYLSEAGGPVAGEELSSHTAMIKLNQEAGYLFIKEENGVRYLYNPNGKYLPPYYLELMDAE